MHDEPLTHLAPGDPLAGLVERELARRMEPQAKARVAAKLGLGGGGGGPTPNTPPSHARSRCLVSWEC